MKYPLKEIVKLFDNPEVSGDDGVELSAIAAIDRAKPSDLTFLGNKKYAHLVPSTAPAPFSFPATTPESFPKIQP